jgi:membrane protease YdiL (CAAX protease family)
MRPDGFWRSCGLPVLVSTGVLAGLNALWTTPLPGGLDLKVVPYPLVVFMLGGSGLALLFIRAGLRGGWLTRHDLGLGLEGWTAPRRLAGLALLVLCGYGQFALLRQRLAGQPVQPTWGDYCFNFFICLSASLAELLVFVGVVHCRVERWLRQRGAGRLPAAAGGVAVAAVAFGLYHFSFEPLNPENRWHRYAPQLVGEMACIVLLFLATRNFWLAMIVHNAVAAGGFTTEQYSPTDPLRFEGVDDPIAVGVMAAAFVLPCLYLHWLEWRGGPAPPAAPGK